MHVSYTPQQLIAFEDEIAALFADRRIHAPVHLAGGNEEQLIHVFRTYVDPQDWVLCSWRSHYHCLLKGVPPDQVRQAILDGKSISLCFPEYRILSSGIVGGTAPIAVGLAMGIMRKQKQRKAVCFVGDMTAEAGGFHEAVKYATNFDLPVLFVIEDNGLSVSTSTAEAWGGRSKLFLTGVHYPAIAEGLGPYRGKQTPKVLRYSYKLTRPHVGVGRHVSF